MLREVRLWLHLEMLKFFPPSGPQWGLWWRRDELRRRVSLQLSGQRRRRPLLPAAPPPPVPRRLKAPPPGRLSVPFTSCRLHFTLCRRRSGAQPLAAANFSLSQRHIPGRSDFLVSFGETLGAESADQAATKTICQNVSRLSHRMSVFLLTVINMRLFFWSAEGWSSRWSRFVCLVPNISWKQ